MSIELLEAGLVGAVLVVQFIVFVRTWSRISDFRSIIPKASTLRIGNISIPKHELDGLSVHDIIVRYASVGRVQEPNGGDTDVSRTEPVSLLLTEGKPGRLFEQIRYSINNYLIRNRGASTDFNLIKDVVERNTSAVEEDINLSVAVPLYLGLMGTMLGIVIGLFSMPDIGTALSDAADSKMGDGIDMLIGGVRIAMIASFAGLLLTVVNSGWRFKAARRHVEARKNDLYTLIQIELLPIINQGMASTLDSLQRNLMRFNEDFTTNLSLLSGVFRSNTESVKAQKELIDTIAEAKISEMAKYNVKVLNKLEGSVGHLERFNEYLINVNLLVGGSQQIVSGVNSFLSRTDDLKKVADTIDQRLHQSGSLLQFLSEHFTQLEEHKALTANAVAEVGHAISGTFDELQAHIGKSTDAVKQFTVDELDALKAALSESKTNLSNLEYLETLSKDVSQMKASTASQMERLKGELDATVRTLGQMSESLRSVDARLAKQGVVAKAWGRIFGKNGSSRK
ncbi:MAG: hypothetical protein IT228_11925 [Flavobacteriales bacterium]|nr:hypothetical protein [Flavobacteriales bacterium]MCC6578042.1 hypothetical protein [Flavobacteriales bacterium]NUQ14610.1 hypothetical protein [Flavobacteriales bacterium]